MLDPTRRTDFDSIDDTWRRIEAWLDSLAQAARTGCSKRDFYRKLLCKANEMLALSACAVWVREAGGWALLERAGADPFPELLASSAGTRLDNAARGSKPCMVTLASEVDPTGDRMSSRCAYGPVILDSDVVAVIEFVLDDDPTDASRESYLGILAAICEIASDFSARLRASEVGDREDAFRRLEDYVRQVHSSVELDKACHAIANESRRFVDCDRCSVVTCMGRSYRVRSVSGVDLLDRRATEVIALERLSQQVLRLGDPLWSSDSGNIAPQISDALNIYLDVSGAHSIAVLPLADSDSTGDPNPNGALVFERFDSGEFDELQRRQAATACRHGATALSNALALRSMPLSGLSRLLRSVGVSSSGSRFPVTVFAILVAVVAIAALVFVRVDFTIAGHGALRPKDHRRVFAPIDGEVRQLHVQHGATVAAGDVLVELENKPLSYELARVLGEIETTRTKLRALRAAGIRASRPDPSNGSRMDDPVAEEELLKRVLENLEQQQAILVQQRDELLVRSPIDGQVLTWRLDDQLVKRPVRQGQELMEVADTDGPWLVELDIGDADIGHVTRARHDQSAPLPVTFMLVSTPSVTWNGNVNRVAMSAETVGDAPPVVKVAVDPADSIPSDARPGDSVVARINCGRRSIGYVWFRRLFEAVRAKLMI